MKPHYLKTLKDKGWLRFVMDLEREGFTLEDVLNGSDKIKCHFGMIHLKNKLVKSFYKKASDILDLNDNDKN